MHSRRELMAGVGIGMLGSAGVARAAGQQATPPQRIGPFYPVLGKDENRADLTRLLGHDARAIGPIVEVSGRVLDAGGQGIGRALVLIWQADGAGRYDHPDDAAQAMRDPNMGGHVLLRTASDGGFHLTTIRPGAYPDGRSASGLRTPHIHYEVIGEEGRLITEMYFPDEPLNRTDANIAEMVGRREDPRLLTARREGTASDPGAEALRWDVVLRNR